MDKNYNIDGFILKVSLKPGLVRFVANYALQYATNAGWRNVERLAEKVLADYKMKFGEELRISKNSLIVEILGHIYTYKIVLGLRKFADWSLFRKLSHHSCKIECGETGIDNNRWIWDLISFTKPLVFLFVSKKR